MHDYTSVSLYTTILTWFLFLSSVISLTDDTDYQKSQVILEALTTARDQHQCDRFCDLSSTADLTSDLETLVKTTKSDLASKPGKSPSKVARMPSSAIPTFAVALGDAESDAKVGVLTMLVVHIVVGCVPSTNRLSFFRIR